MNFHILMSAASIVLLVPAFFLSGGAWLKEALAAGFISYLNGTAAWFLALRTVGRDQSYFMKAVFGGMTARILLMIIVTILLIKSGAVATIPFFLYLVLYYITHQIIEIWMLNRTMPKTHKQDTGKIENEA